jgi:hypothetical protein
MVVKNNRNQCNQSNNVVGIETNAECSNSVLKLETREEEKKQHRHSLTSAFEALKASFLFSGANAGMVSSLFISEWSGILGSTGETLGGDAAAPG